MVTSHDNHAFGPSWVTFSALSMTEASITHWQGTTDDFDEPTNIYMDNTGVVALSNNIVFTTVQNIDIRWHFVQDLFSPSQSALPISRNLNGANFLTKALNWSKHDTASIFWEWIGPLRLRRSVRVHRSMHAHLLSSLSFFYHSTTIYR